MALSRMLAFHCGGPGSIPGRDMSVLGPLVSDGDVLGQVSSLCIPICVFDKKKFLF
jgi:hypothetical protein